MADLATKVGVEGGPRLTIHTPLIALTKAAIDLLGDRALMFASDYPHPETIFPDHADAVIAWRKELGEDATRKLMWENASRFLRLTTTPWSS